MTLCFLSSFLCRNPVRLGFLLLCLPVCRFLFRLVFIKSRLFNRLHFSLLPPPLLYDHLLFFVFVFPCRLIKLSLDHFRVDTVRVNYHFLQPPRRLIVLINLQIHHILLLLVLLIVEFFLSHFYRLIRIFCPMETQCLLLLIVFYYLL